MVQRFKEIRSTVEPKELPIEDSLGGYYPNLRQRVAESMRQSQRPNEIQIFYLYARSLIEKRMRGMRRVNQVVCELLLQISESELSQIPAQNRDWQQIKTFLENTPLQLTKALVPEIKAKAVDQVIGMLQHNEHFLSYVSQRPEILSWMNEYLAWMQRDNGQTMPPLSRNESIRSIQAAIIQYTGRIPRITTNLKDTVNVDYQQETSEGNSTYFAMMTDILSLGMVNSLFFEHQQIRTSRSKNGKENSWPARVEDQLVNGFAFADGTKQPYVSRSLAPREQRLAWIEQKLQK